jgi:hypothetical protein
VIFVVVTLLAVRQRYFIPVHLPSIDVDDIDFFGENLGYLIAVDPSRSPGFWDTTLSGREVLRIAADKIRKAGIPEAELHLPLIRLRKSGDRLRWEVRQEVRSSLGDGTVWVFVIIDDLSGEADFQRYKHP